MNCNDCGGFLPRGCTCGWFGGRNTLAEEVKDAQRTVAGWSKEKRESVQLQGGVIDPRSYSADASGVVEVPRG